MKNKLIALFALSIICTVCTGVIGSNNSKNTRNGSSITMSEEPISRRDSCLSNDDYNSLNDIRFGHWTQKDWFDNDYFRALRKYVNEKLKSKEFPTELKNQWNDKILVLNSAPYVLGGMFVQFIFVNTPEVVYETSIYSKVDESSNTVSDFKVGDIIVATDNSGITEEWINNLLETAPLNKLW